MKIDAVKIALPTKLVSNEDILKLIEENSNMITEQETAAYLTKTKALMRAAGSKTRYWRDQHETPIGLIKDAFNKALEESGWEKESIDLLIYAGVGRGFAEPGDAYIVSQYLGLSETHCFDILDACMSWTRSVYIIYQLFKLGIYKRAVVINGEFSIKEHSYPSLYTPKSLDQLEYTFPAYTCGEGAAVTFLSNACDNEWEFHFSSKPEAADLCTIPNTNFELFCDNPSGRIGRNGTHEFTSYGIQLHKHALVEAVNIFKRLSLKKNEIDIVFPHASSSAMWNKMGQEVGIQDKLYHIYPRTGNLASASIPAAIALSLKDSKLKRGDKVVGWMGSAGMSFSSFAFTY